MSEKFLFTSESVTEGHPDKVADAISDSILDAIMAQDKKCRVACETLVTTGLAFIAGEITTDCYVDMPAIVRQTIKDIVYNSSEMGFDWQTCSVITSIDQQSPDIAMGVDEGENKEQGAGDQGLMFGYAADETPELMPMPVMMAHKLTKGLADARKSGRVGIFRPDGKAQVTIEYDGDVPTRIDAIVVSTQHTPEATHAMVKEAVMEEVIKKVLPLNMLDDKTKYYINPTGKFVVGGPMGDCGLTGRKIIVDTYGGQGSHGGGCFSGKDPSKVDRSASYMGRFVAKNIVAAGLAKRCEVQIAYAIGIAEPVSVLVNTMGTGTVPNDVIAQAVRKVFELKPAGTIRQLDLLRPIYRQTSAYGHFGRTEPEFSWENTEISKKLREVLGV
jgi:S-adenosylmethionine synthetase